MQNQSPLVWEGKGLRLVDLLDGKEINRIIGLSGNNSLFKATHILGDAGRLVDAGINHGLFKAQDIKLKSNFEKTLQSNGYVIVNATDGRMDVRRTGEAVPINGSFPPGSYSKEEIARNFLRGLRAQGERVSVDYQSEPQAYRLVSREFAEYLKSQGEPVTVYTQGDVGGSGFIWGANHERQVSAMLANYKLVTLGANEPNGGQLAEIAKTVCPHQYDAWRAGAADQWRMMETMRGNVIYCMQEMTSGQFSDAIAGGSMKNAIASFQEAFQSFAGDLSHGVVTGITAEKFHAVSSHLFEVRRYFQDPDVKVANTALLKSLEDALTVGTVIAEQFDAKVAERENAMKRSNPEIGLSAGFA